MACFTVATFLLVISLGQTRAQVSPSAYYYYAPWTRSFNGSSSTGRCSSRAFELSVRCNSPGSSVLFDGVIPTLTELDGNAWATDLQTTTSFTDLDISYVELVVSFTLTQDFTGVGSVEVVMFNCPAWEISAESITVLEASGINEERRRLGSFLVTNTSCDSLVTICIDQTTSDPIIALQFTMPGDSQWVHIAEMEFFVGSCRSASAPRVADSVTETATSTSPAATTTSPTITTSSFRIPTTTSTTTGRPGGDGFSITDIIITAVVTAIVVVLLAALVFLLLLVKCRRTKAPVQAATGEQVYEQVDEGSQSSHVIRRNPTLPEPRARERAEPGGMKVENGNEVVGNGNEGIPVVENAAYNNQLVFSLDENAAYNARGGDAFYYSVK